MQTNRRTFVIHSITGAGLMVGVATPSLAQSQPVLLETDATAIALGYKVDATKADKSKFPKYTAGQQCSNCALYQGTNGDTAAGCPLFAGKSVAAKGWCSAWAKKA